jgi:acetolactate decarboxylase
MAGGYDGDMSFGELRERGDFGLGTFNALDGEMLAVDGHFYQVKGDGRVLAAADKMKTPFAAVTFFEAERTFASAKPMGYAELESFIDRQLPSKNIPYAVRIDGRFSFVKTRSVQRQQRPYRKLVDVVKDQKVFAWHDVQGTIVGFRLPAYVQGVNVPGYHLHFITADRTGGGHLLDVRTKEVKIMLDGSSDWHIALPKEGDFSTVDMSGGREGDLEKVERQGER